MIYFATSNEGKFKEARKYLIEKFGVEIKHLKGFIIPEIQDDSLKNIADFSLSFLLEKFNDSVFIEDSGLFINQLDGFPGPYSSYVFKKIGNKGILKLLKSSHHGERKAYFQAVVAFYDSSRNIRKIFTGKVDGIISNEIRGDKGWGFDPIFIPEEGDGRTFAAMGIENKNKFSHRIRALDNLGIYLKKYFNI
jgi:XTP/dITP diphosphohydrolase